MASSPRRRAMTEWAARCRSRTSSSRWATACGSPRRCTCPRRPARGPRSSRRTRIARTTSPGRRLPPASGRGRLCGLPCRHARHGHWTASPSTSTRRPRPTTCAPSSRGCRAALVHRLGRDVRAVCRVRDAPRRDARAAGAAGDRPALRDRRPLHHDIHNGGIRKDRVQLPAVDGRAERPPVPVWPATTGRAVAAIDTSCRYRSIEEQNDGPFWRRARCAPTTADRVTTMVIGAVDLYRNSALRLTTPRRPSAAHGAGAT